MDQQKAYEFLIKFLELRNLTAHVDRPVVNAIVAHLASIAGVDLATLMRPND